MSASEPNKGAPRPPGKAEGLSDEQILHVHEHAMDNQPDDLGAYKYLPLVLLFLFSGLIFYGGTYLNQFAGEFDPRIFNENAKPKELAAGPAIDPVIFGQKSYAALCATCHLPEGQGQPLAGIPPIAGSEWVTGSEERLVRIILHGLQGPITVKGELYNTQKMPAVGTQPGWDDSRVAATLTYIRQAFGNTAGPIVAEKVAEIRAKSAGHAEWTEAELKQLP